MTHSTGALVRTDHPASAMSAADSAAHAAASHIRLPADIADVVSRYVSAALRFDELSVRPAVSLSPSEAAELRATQPVIAEMFEAVSVPGRRGLVVAAEVAVRYHAAAARYRTLAADGDYDRCLPVQDEMTMCRCQLAKAGLLYLVEAEHEKVKDPLPIRPRGPHPQRTTAAV